jgi:hypothetical protein
MHNSRPGTPTAKEPLEKPLWLAIAEVNGKRMIIWAQFLGPIC